MNKLHKYLKREMDVEFFSCVNAMSMVFLYGFILWANGIKEVPFAVIFEMMILSYVMAWFQKVLFLKEKVYKKFEYQIRVVLWSIGPIAMMIGVQVLFHWFAQVTLTMEILFVLIMLGYWVMLWIFLQRFYQDDTSELNQMIEKYKGGFKDE